jgi:hypothetical protein
MTSPTDTSPLHALAYASTASREMSDAELEQLMVPTRAFNQAHGITGMLLYSGGTFLQALEGPEPALRLAFARIRSSTRHYGLIELLDQPVAEREFGAWSMGYGRVAPTELARLSATEGQALRTLMAGFWASHRR